MRKATEILVRVLLVLVAIGALVLVALCACWPAGMEYKIGLLRSLLVASAALAGFAALLLIKLARDGEKLVREQGMSEKRMKNIRILVSWSIILGFLTVLAVMFYFLVYETPLMVAAWVLFIGQVELFILPLIFSRILAFR